MAVDESFKRAGAVPFKWEIVPGVPIRHHQPPQSHRRPSLSAPSSPSLKPPPALSYFLPPPLPPSPSIGASPRSRSDRLRFEHSTLVRAEIVSSGCFPSPAQKRRASSSKRAARKTPPVSEADYLSDLETLQLSPSVWMWQRSSGGGARDSDWAGFGLF